MPPLRGSVQPSLYFLLPRRELLLKVLQPPLPGEVRRKSSNQRTTAAGNPSTLKQTPEEVVTKC
jgi:hypothetical protein